MTRIRTIGLAVALALLCLAALWGGIAVQARGLARQVEQQGGESEAATPPARERDGDGSPDTPTISFIDDPTAQCYRPVQHTDACYIQWQYLNVTASSSQYIISMTASIDNRIRAYYGGFFQSSMYAPGDMQSPGFRVSCGQPGSGGLPNLGKAYSWVVRARETGGLSAANYGTVYCPADTVPPQNVSLAGPSQGVTGQPYTFTASLPITTSLPVTYTWTVTGQTPVTVTGGLTSTRTYTWPLPGAKQVAVHAANAAGSAEAARTITLASGRIYLPIIHK